MYRLTLCSASEWYYYGALILNAVCAIHAHLNHISNFPWETSPAEQGVSKYLACAHSRMLKRTHTNTHTLVALMYCTKNAVCQFSQAAPARRAGKTVRWGTCLTNLIALSGNAMINVGVMSVDDSCGIVWFHRLATERSRLWAMSSFRHTSNGYYIQHVFFCSFILL